MMRAKSEGGGSPLPLSAYLAALERAGLTADAQDPRFSPSAALSPSLLRTPVDTLTCDTRTLAGRSLFLCKGAHFREEYLRFAAANGAICYLSEKKYEVGIPFLPVTDVRATMSVLAKLHFGAPDEKLVKIAVTGTKGKSTVAYFVRAILDLHMQKTGGMPCAVLSSIENYDGETLAESHLTTPEPIELFAHFAAAARSGISHLVMEASSQGLKYGRLRGVRFEAAAFLNIGEDHVSPIEHSDLEDYFTSKLKIFDHAALAAVNLEMPSPFRERVLDTVREKRLPLLTFGRRPEADVYGFEIEKQGPGFRFRVRTDGAEHQLSVGLPGFFNVDNALAAVALCRAVGVPMETIAEGLAGARVSGRMEVFESADDRVTVIVDYAHNKMSFEALFDSVKKEYPGRPIVAVYGCPGGKAQGRRRDLPEISGKFASHVIVTEEDSGEEPFSSIASDITAHLEGRTDYRVREDRGEAIREAILELGQDSVILVTGKGEETRQKRGTFYVDCPSDVDYTKKYLAEYDRRASARAAEEKETT